jgi:hypothetical protein
MACRNIPKTGKEAKSVRYSKDGYSIIKMNLGSSLVSVREFGGRTVLYWQRNLDATIQYCGLPHTHLKGTATRSLGI